MSKKKSGLPTVAGSPSGPRYDLEPPVLVVDEDPPPTVIHHETSVAGGDRAPHSVPTVEHQSGSRNVPMTPYGGGLVAVSSDLGDNW